MDSRLRGNDKNRMSALQISLAIAGGLVLAGVVAQGAWAARKSVPKRALAPADATQTVPAQLRQEPGFAAPAPEKKPGLDALIDVLSPIALESSVAGEAVLSALPTTRRVGTKPFAIEGLNAATGQWESPVAGQRYSAFQAGVQLANRTGALNEIEYSEFVIKTQQFADAEGVAGEPQFTEMQGEVARARELDQFASAIDAKLSFVLRARAVAWSPGYVQQTAANLGFVPGAIAGRMVLVGAHGPIVGLAFDPQAALAEDPEQSALRELNLSLDVPQVPRSERAFERMCEVAITLAARMDGVIKDSSGHPIDAGAMDAIAADLEKLYDTLEQHDLAAGGGLARRLFS
jgi:hypothetical protein